MAANITEMNTLEIRFMGPLALDVAKDHADQFTPYLLEDLGPDWAERLKAVVLALGGAVDVEIKEHAEAADAVRLVDVQLVNVGPWRRSMEKLMNGTRAGPAREDLRAVSGYGLGPSRTVKEAREFLTRVAPLVELRKDALLKRGILPAVVAFPARALAVLQEGNVDVAREKAEAALATVATRAARQAALEVLDRMDDAVELAVAQSTFLETDAERAAVEKLAARWISAVNEARVQTRARVAQGDIPATLTATDVVVPAGGDAPQPG